MLDVNEDVVHVSWICVRCAPVSTTKAVLNLGRRLNRQKDNARKTSGDEGKMYAIGSRDTITEDGSVLQFVFQDNNGMLESLQKLNTEALPYLRQDFNEVLSTFRRMEIATSCDVSIPDTAKTNTKNHKGFITSTMFMSVDLCNAGHVDVTDSTYSVCTWATKDDKEEDEGWQLMLPNLCLTGSNLASRGVDLSGVSPSEYGNRLNDPREPGCVNPKATSIKLFSGCTVSWDGTVVNHCTARSSRRDGTNTSPKYGCFWSGTREQHRLSYLLQTVGRDALVAELNSNT